MNANLSIWRKPMLSMVSCLALTFLAGKAQSIRVVGMDVSDISIKGMFNYPDSALKLSDFNGKYVLLDFWTTGCGTCISKMPLMDSLQKEFGNEIQIILVNSKESTTKVAERLHIIEQRLKKGAIVPNALPASIGDTALNGIFPHITVPHHVWIDPKGYVLYITNGYNTTRENIKRLIAGEEIDANEKRDLERDFFESETLASWAFKNSVSGMVDSDEFLLLPYQEEMEGPVMLAGKLDTSTQLLRFTYPNVTMTYLYNAAFRDSSNGSQFGISTDNFISRTRWLVKTNHPAWAPRPGDVELVDFWKRDALFSCELMSPEEDAIHFGNELRAYLDEYTSRHQGVTVTKKCIVTECLIFSELKSDNNVQPRGEEKAEGKFSSYLLSIYYLNSSLFDELGMPLIMSFDDGLVILPEPRKYADLKELRKVINQWGYDVQIRREKLDMMVVEDIAHIE